MKTYNDLIQRWDMCKGGQLLVDKDHPINNMYLNVNEKGNRELLIPVLKPITKFPSTEAIGLNNYQTPNGCFFVIELLTENLINEFASLCFDLLQTSRMCSSKEDAVDTLFDTFRKWYFLMAQVQFDILSVSEIRGLMGELKYIIDELNAGKPEHEIVEAWTIHKDASRDFIFDDTWAEIKTIKSTSDYITISSLEQLDHNMNGKLVVYKLDQSDIKTDNMCTLNSMVDELRNVISVQSKAVLNRKLLAKGYVYSEEYENYIYEFKKRTVYFVDETFPRLSRSSVNMAIKSAKYDILLNMIEEWRVMDGE